jgi:hypothetical protein
MRNNRLMIIKLVNAECLICVNTNTNDNQQLPLIDFFCPNKGEGEKNGVSPRNLGSVVRIHYLLFRNLRWLSIWMQTLCGA